MPKDAYFSNQIQYQHHPDHASSPSTYCTGSNYDSTEVKQEDQSGQWQQDSSYTSSPFQKVEHPHDDNAFLESLLSLELPESSAEACFTNNNMPSNIQNNQSSSLEYQAIQKRDRKKTPKTSAEVRAFKNIPKNYLSKIASFATSKLAVPYLNKFTHVKEFQQYVKENKSSLTSMTAF
eukprot:CAMPEP_0114585734 /NCGR_PEP_ID=MMETSP0125-20121206/9187_1 /TAXON_ID=485358 ORGANISM="Aristerostoma sp., Strain ATCC 50986" /NCGR_SAMPLE_ID=MMETSP0125 /ASSEMBLY_ACC=CAM_ASM_000245 /LENGTH=177 /DNA_ID=CAMNT_0001780927 /DNA_START=170 /DNA_END=703 /DNA_ORIENTATION=+